MGRYSRKVASPPMLSDHQVATDVATRAGEVLLALRAGVGATAHDWWSLRDEGDWSAHRFIVEALHELRPDDKVLSEEGIEDRSRLGAERVWIVDPLDGTREFGEPGRTDWAVHVALVDGRGQPLDLGGAGLEMKRRRDLVGPRRLLRPVLSIMPRRCWPPRRPASRESLS